MRWLALAMIMPTPIMAQVQYPPVAVDLSNVPSKADVQAATSAAAAAQAAAAAACVATPSVPPTEQPGGAAGTNNGQCRPVNSVQPRITRVRPFTTDATGKASVTYQDIGTTDLGTIVTVNMTASSNTLPTCGPDLSTLGRTGVTIYCKVPILNLGVLNVGTGPSGVTGTITVLPNTPAS